MGDGLKPPGDLTVKQVGIHGFGSSAFSNSPPPPLSPPLPLPVLESPFLRNFQVTLMLPVGRLDLEERCPEPCAHLNDERKISHHKAFT